MNSPEVVNFEPPRTLMQSTTGDIETVIRKIQSNPAVQQYHTITVVLPDISNRIPDDITACYNDQIYYLVRNLPVHQFVDPEFLTGFVKTGILEAQTINNWTDVDESVVLHPSGKLELSVGKDVYQELGLVGSPEIILGRNVVKHKITVNLLDESFYQGSKIHERVSWCLKNRLNLKYDWIIKWTPHDSEICPSSLAAYLDHLEFKVKQCKAELQLNRLYGIAIPELLKDDEGPTQFEIHDLIEWAGAAALHIECPTESSYASALTCPEPRKTDVGQVAVISWHGYFSSNKVAPLLEAVNNLMKDSYGPTWFNVTLHGFDQNPAITGSPLTSIFITPSPKCYLFTLSCPTNKVK